MSETFHEWLKRNGLSIMTDRRQSPETLAIRALWDEIQLLKEKK